MLGMECNENVSYVLLKGDECCQLLLSHNEKNQRMIMDRQQVKAAREVVSKQMADVGKRAVTMSNTYTEKHKCKMTIFLMLG
jgi:hypothetical protein